MVRISAVAEIGALLGDAGRVNMIAGLLDGRALTARELAALAGVTPQTASGHLAKLGAAGLIVVERQGRHRYHRLASAEVARMVEAMMNVAQRETTPRTVRVGPRDAALREARTCYDHLAGRLGVGLADSLQTRGYLILDDDGGAVSPAGRVFLTEFGLDLDQLAGGRRAFCRPCLDWSERRPHLAGALGGALMARLFDLGWIRRVGGTRAVAVSVSGESGLHQHFGLRHAREG